MRKQFTKLEQQIWTLVWENPEGFTPRESIYIIQQLMADA